MSPTILKSQWLKRFLGFYIPICSCPYVYNFLFTVIRAKIQLFVICTIKLHTSATLLVFVLTLNG